MEKMRGLGLSIVILALTLSFFTPLKFYPISTNQAILETPFYIFTMFLPLWIGFSLLYSNLWLGILVCYTTLNMMLRPDTLSIQEAIWFASACLFIEVIRHTIPFKWDKKISYGFAALAIFQSFYAIHQWFGYDIFWSGSKLVNHYIHGTLGNPNYLGVLFVLCASIMPLTLTWLIIPGVVLTHSYGAIFGFILIMTVRLWEYAWTPLAVSALLIGFLIKSLHSNIPTWKFSWIERLAVWWVGLVDVSTNAPVFGFGIGGWFSRAPALQEQSGLTQLLGEYFAQAHNEYIQYYYEFGLMGLLILGILFYQFKYILIKPPMIAIAVSCIGMFPFHIMVLAMLMIVLIGMSLRNETSEAIEEVKVYGQEEKRPV